MGYFYTNASVSESQTSVPLENLPLPLRYAPLLPNAAVLQQDRKLLLFPLISTIAAQGFDPQTLRQAFVAKT